MIGTKLDELYEYLLNNREIEFKYLGKEYALQAEEENNDAFLGIWEQVDESKFNLISRVDLLGLNKTSKEDIDKILNVPCFYGKTFMEIEKNVEVTYIF